MVLEGISQRGNLQVLNLSNNYFIEFGSDGQYGFFNKFKILHDRPNDRELESNEIVQPADMAGILTSIASDENLLSARSMKSNPSTQNNKTSAPKKKKGKLTDAEKLIKKREKAIEEVTRFLTQIISNSSQLMHLDLSNTGLSEKMMLKVIKAVKRSRSLMGVHLSGNEGMSEAFIAKGLNLIEATHE